MTSIVQRAELGRLMDMLVADEPKVHYLPKRPMVSKSIVTVAQLRQKLASNLGISLDCSESVTLLCKLAGLKDPNDSGYDGYGNTGTLLTHLPHYHAPFHALTGALVVFGPGSGKHVCMVREPGTNPLLFSHGSERGPIFIRLDRELAFQGGPVTFLDISNL